MNKLTAAGLTTLVMLLAGCDATQQSVSPFTTDIVVAVSPRSAQIDAIGDVAQLKVTINPGRQAPTVQHYTWMSLNPEVATVDTQGRVTSVARGEARIVAVAGGGADTARVTVVQTPAMVKVFRAGVSGQSAGGAANPVGELGNVGATLKLSAEIRDRKGHPIPDAQVQWTSLDPAVVTAMSDGTVQAKGSGNGRVVGQSGPASDTAYVVVQLPLVAIEIEPGSRTLTAIGETLQLVARARDTAGESLPVSALTWQSLDPGVASVSEQGVVTAVANGFARIIARSGSLADTATITVQQVPSSVSVAPSTLNLQLGQSVAVSASVRDARGNSIPGATVAWTTAHPAIASVSPTGLVTATAAGTTTLTATSGGRSASAQISVASTTPTPIAAIAVAPASASVQIGRTVDLTAQALDASNQPLTGRVLSWTSSNVSVATVDSNGRVSGVSAGTAIVSASAEGKSGSAQITVLPAGSPQVCERVVISPRVDTLRAIGATRQLTATATSSAGTQLQGVSMEWLTLSPTIAGVGEMGLVTAKNVGAALIVASAAGCAQSDTANIVIDPAVYAVIVTPETVQLTPGASTTLHATAKDSNGATVVGAEVEWSSSQPAIATVDQNGKVTALKTGFAGIIAKVGGKAATAVVQVSSASQTVSTVTVAPSAATVGVGETLALQATARDSAGNVISNAPISWSVSNHEIISVSSSGVVTGLHVGNGQVTATSGGKSGSAVINVTTASSPTVASVSVSPTSASVAVGSSTTLQATARDASNNVIPGATMAWSSSNTSIATVDQNGKVTGVAGGSATITVSSGGKSATAAVTVTASSSGPVSTITVSPSTTSVDVGSSVTLQATARDASGNVVGGVSFSWSSSNTGTATVNGSGTVTGVSTGTVTITALASGKSATATVTVTNPPPPPPPGSLNEPAGMTRFFSTDGSVRDFGPKWIKASKWLDDRYTRVVSDAGNPTGSGKAIEKRWYVGEPTDNGGGLTTLHHWSDVGGFPARVLYIRMRLKFSPNWDTDGHYGGVKFGYWGSDGRGGAAPTQYWTSNGGAGGSSFRIFFQDQTGPAPNFNKFSSNAPLSLNQWHTVEILQTAQSAKGVADGALKIWVDGVLSISESGINFVGSSDNISSTLFNGIQVFFIRGSAGRTFRVDDWLRLGELYVSGRK